MSSELNSIQIQQEPPLQESPHWNFDPSLYLVINPEQCRYENPVDLATKAVSGGVSAVQVRSKFMSDRDYTELVTEVADELQLFQVPVFVNDRIEVAAATGVRCLHLGQDDATVHAARQSLGSEARIGLTVRSLNEAKRAPLEELSYISVGGVFATRSKHNPDPPIGLRTLAAIVAELKSRGTGCPIVAISGINLTNLNSVLATGVDGIAVVSAICESSDPQSTAREFRMTINQFSKDKV